MMAQIISILLKLMDLFIYTMFQVSMFIFDMDAKSLYKKGYSKSLDHITQTDISGYGFRRRTVYLLPPFFIEESRWDWWRRHFRLLITTHVCWLTLKFSLFIVGDIAMFNDLREFLEKANKTNNAKVETVIESKLASSVAFTICELLGDPTWNTPSVSFSMYGGMIVGFMNGIFLFSFRHRVRPWEGSPISLYLVPDREARRIDLHIRELLTYVKTLVRGELNPTKQKRKQYSIDMSSPTKQRKVSKVSDIKSLDVLCSALLSYIPSMRPKIFQDSFIMVHKQTLFIIVLAMLLFFAVPGLMIPIVFMQSIYAKRCRFLDIKVCTLGQAFNWRHWITLLELLISLVLICWVFILQVVLLSDIYHNQLTNITDLNLDLSNIITILKSGNDEFSQDKNNQKLVVSREVRTRFWLKQTNYYLLKIWIKSNVIYEELKKSSHIMKEILNSNLVTIGCTLILDISCELFVIEWTDEYQMKYLGNVRYLVVVWMLFVSNLSLIICADYKSKSNQLHKMVSSLNAQINRRKQLRAESKQSDFIDSCWHRMGLVQTTYNPASINFLDVVPINYAQILSLNLILLSLAAVLRNF